MAGSSATTPTGPKTVQVTTRTLDVRGSAEDAASDRHEVVMFLHDFSSRSGEEFLADFTLGAVRVAVHVPATAMVTIAIDAVELAMRILHCHHMAHMATGMMTELDLRTV